MGTSGSEFMHLCCGPHQAREADGQYTYLHGGVGEAIRDGAQ